MGTSQGRASRTIAEKDIRQRIRDRTALLVGVLLPFALASILALTLGGAAEGDLDLDIGLVDLDGGAVADRFEQTLRAADVGTRAPCRRSRCRRTTSRGRRPRRRVRASGWPLGSVHIRWRRVDRGDRLARLRSRAAGRHLDRSLLRRATRRHRDRRCDGKRDTRGRAGHRRCGGAAAARCLSGHQRDRRRRRHSVDLHGDRHGGVLPLLHG